MLKPLQEYVLTNEQLIAYLERIGLADIAQRVREGASIEADRALLDTVQQAHLHTVPFENLEIFAGNVPLDLGLPALYDKIVVNKRGGICYEQNLLFAAALQALGYTVLMRAGRHPKYGDDMDHIFFQVDIPGEEAPLLTDVGFAVNFSRPLQLVLNTMQDDGRNRFELREQPDMGEGYIRIWCTPGLSGDAEEGEMFTFTPLTYEPEDCVERCYWMCTDPKSRFVQGPLISIDAPDGRKTLSANHYVVTKGDERTSVDIDSEQEYAEYLHREFGI